MRHCMILSLLCAAVVFQHIASRHVVGAEPGFVSLFDGTTLTGWEGNKDIFRVEEGAIVAGSLKDRIAHNEFLCSQREFQDFELRLKAKLVGEGDNAGIQFRSKRIPDHHEVIGYQCDMGSAFGRKIWGALYDESRRRKVLTEAKVQDELLKVLRAEGWNDFVIRCEGDHIQIWLNGLKTVDYVEKEDVAKRGILGLQVHGGKPAEAWYKDIRIKVLQ